MVGNRILLQTEGEAGAQGKSPSRPPSQAAEKKGFGKKPEPEMHKPSPVPPLLPGRFSDTYPRATDEDFKGRCNCLGDNNPHISREELEEKTNLPLDRAPYDLGN